MSDKLKFQRDFPEVCDLWKNFDHRARYTADNMMHAYCAGYAARGESIADQPAATETAPQGALDPYDQAGYDPGYVEPPEPQGATDCDLCMGRGEHTAMCPNGR